MEFAASSNHCSAESSSSSDDQFADAQEGLQQGHTPADRSSANSPIPVTRVEKVDTSPSYGEVPGTPAYQMRMQDAVPDEVEVIPDGQRSRSMSRLRAEDRPFTPGGSPIPTTIVEKIDPDTPAHGDVPGTAAFEARKMDATPDVILKAPQPPTREGSAARKYYFPAS
jgi:hypothetical protein